MNEVGPRLQGELRELVELVDRLQRENAELSAAAQKHAQEAAAYLAHWQAAQESRQAAIEAGLRAACEISVRDHVIARLEEQLGLSGRENDELRARLATFGGAGAVSSSAGTVAA